MKTIKQVRLSGFGGQGIILAGVILGNAATLEDKWVAGSSHYGVQARGGEASYDLVISSEPITFPHVIDTDILITMSQDAFEKYIKTLKHDGLHIFDKDHVSIFSSKNSNEGERHKNTEIPVPATFLALDKLGKKQAANMVMVGAIAQITGLVGMDSLIRVLKENVAEKFIDLNIEAIKLGMNLGA